MNSIGYRMCRPGETGGNARTQRGVALVVALILLVVITLIGLAAVSGTIMQSKMAANQYDRQTAFQNAESALHAAQQYLQANPVNPPEVARHCGPADPVCLSNPFTDPNLPAGSIYAVPIGNNVEQYTAATLATGQPEYVIEYMDTWKIPGSALNSQSASCHGYGATVKGCGPLYADYYRVTARSGDPAQVGERAIVTLQAVFAKSQQP